ncbi:helicase-exonuclease AddAB subunit AddA [Lacticaseibacillus mingshuiensis]|uniref:DNA 3'-5' helicase n=1 Tax=Lacticaseibacillus mingshuiensis TaxID=2799574 RepID=A0ABW4CF50_9LACO|nr:helicase-exonuclease AddAB subunit AddA [Lacticaseibacillus mingshuiensis]
MANNISPEKIPAILHGTFKPGDPQHRHDVLVSASAGSGKTFVLVQRILRQLIDGAELDRMLIVTFTKAAAAEMRTRIEKELKATLRASDDAARAGKVVPETKTQVGLPLTEAQKAHIQAQIDKMTSSWIMTIDAFSQRVVQSYYYVIGLDPSFRILSDETEEAMLKQRVWEQTRDHFYEADGVAAHPFAALEANFYSKGDAGRDGLGGIVDQLLTFAMSTQQPTNWLAHLADGYQPERVAAQFHNELWPAIHETLTGAVAKLNVLRTELEDAFADRKPTDTMKAAVEGIQRFAGMVAELPDQPDYATVWTALHPTETYFPTWPYGTKKDEARRDLLAGQKARRDAITAELNTITDGPLQLAPADREYVAGPAAALMTTLADVALWYADALLKEKERQHLAGFGDIEQYALQILTVSDTVAQNYQAQFDIVMIDEYQDTNGLQEALLSRVAAQAPGNRFMVGDVKQSIYGFRLADPSLFMTKYQTYPKLAADQPAANELILLPSNFRSTNNVLTFINMLFAQIMDQEVGELDYDQDAELKFGSSDSLPSDLAGDAQAKATLLLVAQEAPAEDDPNASANAGSDDAASPETTGEETADENGEDAAAIAKDQAEAQAVIAKILTIVHNPDYQLYDRVDDPAADLTAQNWPHRDVDYKDIAILASTRGNNITLQSEFAKAGVPILIPDAKNYFKTTELMVMLSLLRIIDNPKQDIPLAAVLRSPLVALSADEMATIRLAAKARPYYYDALAVFQADPATKETPLGQKLARFFALLADLRDYAREHALVDLIWHIYSLTGFLDYVGGMPGGNQRQVNLRALASRAAAYEANGFKGLFAFVRFIEQMQKKDKDLDTPVSLADGEDAVRLMTIHGSKGLEFPIVFLLDADHGFNMRDTMAPIIATKDAVGLKFNDPATQITFTTPQYAQAAEAKRKQLLAEEMRKLYVALTRAGQRLFIVAMGKKEKLLPKWRAAAAASEEILLPSLQRGTAKNFMDWIGPALARCADSEDDAKTLPALTPYFPAAGFTIEEVLPKQSQAGTTGDETEVVDEAAPMPGLTDWLNFRYPFAQMTTTSGFRSVTEIKRAVEDPDLEEAAAASGILTLEKRAPAEATAPTVKRWTADDFHLPAFMAAEDQTRVSATDVGTATHLVLQRLDLKKAVDEPAIRAFIHQLVQDGLLTAPVAQRIRVAQLAAFFQTALGQQLQAAAHVEREAAFSMLLPASRIAGSRVEDDQADVLVHGIIDGYFEENGALTLFDYKTDRIGDSVAPILARYRGQLNSYAEALNAMHPTGPKVAHAWLILLNQNGEAHDVLAAN